MSKVFKEFQLGQKVSGDLGIEIEVEGARLPYTEEWWRNEQDGSLKGEETREYVLDTPQSLEGVKAALDYLDAMYKNYKSRVDDTVRAGVHVHVNCQDLSLTELYTFMCVYLTLENVLVHWCGEYREGNLFCLRATDAEYLLKVIKYSTVLNGYNCGRRLREDFHRDELRYSSMNLKALGDYGSVEFRAMRGTRDLNLIYKWAETLLGLREYAKTLKSPVEVIDRFSVLGPSGFLREALGANHELFEYPGQDQALWEGMRNAQDVAFCTDWQKFDPEMYQIGNVEFPITMKSGDINEPLEDV